MGRGGYLGGNTIITAWGSGWSRDAQSPIKKKANSAQSSARKKKRPASSKKPTYKKQFQNYARNCGLWTRKNKPWLEAPNLVKEHFDSDLEVIRKAVLESYEYEQGRAGGKKKTKKNQNTACAKKIIKEERKAKNLLMEYVKACAKTDFKQKERPSIPLFITEKYSADDVKEWLSQVHHTAPYKTEIRKLKGRTTSRASKKSKKRKVPTNG